MFRALERQIQDQAELIETDRLALSTHSCQLAARLRRQLATPQALAAGFGGGLLFALLRGRHPRAAADQAAAGPTRLRSLASWLLRELALPAAMAAISRAQAGQGFAGEDADSR